MSESLTVLIDMDGVIVDFDAEVESRIADRYPHIQLLGKRTNHYISDDYPEHKHLIREMFDQPGFFQSLPIADDALEGWERLIDLGYNPRICSSPVITNPGCKSEKLGWLEHHFVPVFGKSVVEQAIITSDKYLVDARALIDDCPEIEKANEASWAHVVYDKPYNQQTVGLRLHGWLDERLPEILEEIRYSS